jgi:hypothetical protein
VAIALMIGVPLLLLGIAMVLDRHPSWLGWTGLVIGGITMLAAVGLFLIPSLFPGFLLYGVLSSVVAQLWLVATGDRDVATCSRSTRHSHDRVREPRRPPHDGQSETGAATGRRIRCAHSACVTPGAKLRAGLSRLSHSHSPLTIDEDRLPWRVRPRRTAPWTLSRVRGLSGQAVRSAKNSRSAAAIVSGLP